MKYSDEKVRECVEWVEMNGLHPQRCGASVKDFCKAMGIDDATYRRWLENAEFADALSRARVIFQEQTVRDVENSLIKAAKGYTFEEFHDEKKASKVVEYDPKTGKKVREYMGDVKLVKRTRTIVNVQPNIDAAKFVLTNMAGNDWKQKQEVKTDVEFIRPIVVRSEDEKKMVENLRESGL